MSLLLLLKSSAGGGTTHTRTITDGMGLLDDGPANRLSDDLLVMTDDITVVVPGRTTGYRRAKQRRR